MSLTALISVNEAAKRLGITPRSVARRVRAGTLHPVMKMPGQTGAYLLSEAEVQAAVEAETKARQTAAS